MSTQKTVSNLKTLALSRTDNVTIPNPFNQGEDDLEQIVLKEVEKNHQALYYASNRLKKDKIFILKLLDNDLSGLPYVYIDESLKLDEEIVLKVVQCNYTLIWHADSLEGVKHFKYKKFTSNQDFMLSAISQNGALFGYSHESLRENFDFCLKAISLKFCLKAISLKASSYKHIPTKYKSDTTFLLTIFKKWIPDYFQLKDDNAIPKDADNQFQIVLKNDINDQGWLLESYQKYHDYVVEQEQPVIKFFDFEMEKFKITFEWLFKQINTEYLNQLIAKDKNINDLLLKEKVKRVEKFHKSDLKKKRKTFSY
jgi:hypothetical protein